MARPGGAPENLKPFKKGNVANPNGRPKGVRNSSTVLREFLAAALESENIFKPTGQTDASGNPTFVKESLTAQQIMLMSLIAKAMKGNLAAIDRVLQLVGEKSSLDDGLPEADRLIIARLFNSPPHKMIDITPQPAAPNARPQRRTGKSKKATA